MFDVTQAEESSVATQAIWQAEISRINAMNRLALADAPVAAPIYLPDELTTRGAEVCGSLYRRSHQVASARELTAALATAQPGDLIQLADGVYRGNFVATVSGTAAAPIILCGSRMAVLERGSIEQHYGFHLQADYWVLTGFTVRNALKGIMLDGANHNHLRGLEIYQIGEEGVHFRKFSSDNLIEHSWVHDVGLHQALYGEGIYIGSAVSNWPVYTDGSPDRSDRNQVIGNLLGPNTTAEGIDIKEGTSAGAVMANIFIGVGMTAADSWIDVKGNAYVIDGNRGVYDPARAFKQAVEVHEAAPDWGQNNRITQHPAQPEPSPAKLAPFRAAYGDKAVVSMVLTRRVLPYTLTELRIRFPAAFETITLGVVRLKEHIVAAQDAHLTINSSDVHELQLLSTPEHFVSIVAKNGTLTMTGNEQQHLRIRSWNSATNSPDLLYEDGRAFVLAQGGRMDLKWVDFFNLGFGTGATSGVAWRGLPSEKIRGDVTGSRFEGNYFGAYTFEAEGMQWRQNSFANNIVYGFDPHDFSNNFLVEENLAHGNGKHGIIFSRGCSGNTIRRNTVFNNRGHGIFLDDGKVTNDGDARHASAVPSNNNLVTENEVWSNDVGIVLEGGAGNIVRANTLYNNRFGIRLKDNVINTEIVANTIRANVIFAIYIYNQSTNNRIFGNLIEGAQGGVILKDSPANRVEGNTIVAIVGRGIVLVGDASGSLFTGNTLAGRGSDAIDVMQATKFAAVQTSANHTADWLRTGPPTFAEEALSFVRYRPALLVWLVVLIVPLATMPLRWQSRKAREQKQAEQFV